MEDIHHPQEASGAVPIRRKRRLGGTVALVFALLVVVAGAVFLLNRQQRSSLSAGVEGENLTAEQIEVIVAKVGKHLVLPEGEVPVVATVVDAESLRASQPFYQNIDNGDYLLIYQNQARAILYDPKNDILVNVGAVQTADAVPAPDSSQEPSSDEEI